MNIRYLRDFAHGTGMSIEKGGHWVDEKWIEGEAVKISNNAVAAYSLLKRYGKTLPRLIQRTTKELGEWSAHF